MKGTPRYINRGIRDLSILPVMIDQSEHGQHLAKWFIKAERGNYEPQIMTASEAINYFGAETFSKSSKYFNHQTMFAKKAMSNSKVILQRINLGGSAADVTHYIDIVETTATLKHRTPFGMIDNTSADMVVDAPVLKVRHVAVPGGATEILDGTMFEDDGTTPSKMYPIFKLQGGIGEYYNNIGYTLRQRQASSASDVKLLGQSLYDFQLKLSRDGVVNTIKTLVGSTSAKVGLVQGTDPVTQAEVRLGEVMPESYYNEVDPLTEWRYTDITIDVNEDMIGLVTKRIAAHEAAFIFANSAALIDTAGDALELSSLFEVTGDAANFERLNALMNVTSLKSTTDVPYFSVMLDDTSVAPAGHQVGNEDTVFYLGNGSDVGAITTEEQAEIDDADNPKSAADILDDRYHNEITNIMTSYLDTNSELQETALSPESIIYDSGFPMLVKESLCNVIGVRSDTAVVLSTYICSRDGKNIMTAEDEISIGVTLKNRLLLTPESTYFGTEVCRAVIFGGSCVATFSDYKGRIPTTYDFLAKASAYMGASNQLWNTAKSFDSGEESAATEIKEILPKYVPGSVKDKLWATGINWLEPLYTKKIYHWTAFATVASDKSTLNSVFTMFAACWITKKEILAWKIFTGESRSSPTVFKEEVESYMSKELAGAFDDRFPIRPVLTIDAIDAKTGFSWHLDTRIGTNSMYTVVRNSVTVTRMSDF